CGFAIVRGICVTAVKRAWSYRELEPDSRPQIGPPETSFISGKRWRSSRFIIRSQNARASTDVRSCSRALGISLAHLPTWGDTCNPPSTSYWDSVCPMLGMYADFEKDKLTLLRYTFYVGLMPSAEDSTDFELEGTCNAFAEKYGKPHLQTKT